MRGRRLLRPLLIAAGVLVLLFVCGPWLIPKMAVRDFVVRRLGDALQRPVAVERVDAGLWPRPHVTLAGLHVGADPSGPLASLDLASLRCELAWGPLLRRRLEIVELALQAPRVELRIGPKDTAAGARPAAGPGGVGPAGPPLAVSVRELTVRDGRVVVRRADGGTALEIGGLSEDLSASLTPGGDLSLRGETRADSLRVHLPRGTLGDGLSVSWTKDLRYETGPGRLSIASSTLRLGELPLTVAGVVDSLGGSRPRADLQMQGGPVQASSLLGYLPSHLFPQLEGVRSAGTLALQGSLRGILAAPPPTGPPPYLYNVRFDLANGSLEHPRLAQPVRGIELHLQAASGRLQVEQFAAATERSKLLLSGFAADLATSPVVDFDVVADLDLAEVTALQTTAAGPAVALAGRFSGSFKVSGPAADPAAVDVRGEGRLTKVSASGPDLVPPVSDLDGPVRMEGDVLLLDGVFLRQGRSDYRLTGSLRNYLALVPAQPGQLALSAPPALVDATVHSERIDADEYAQKKTARTGGAEAGRQAGAGRSESGLASLALLEGRVALTAGEVLTRGHRLTELRGTVVLERGLLRFENAAAGLYGGQADLGGSIDLRDPRHGRLDLTVRMREVQAGELSQRAVAMSRFAGLAGCLNGVVGGQATLKGALDDTFGLDLKTFTSAGSIELDQARLSGHPLQSQLAGYLNTPSLETLAVQKWLQPFRIEDGRLHVDGLDLRAGDVQLKAAGWQSLDGAVDMQVQVTLPAKMAQGIRSLLPAGTAQLLLDGSDQPLVLPLSVKGQATSPQVGLDAGALTAQASARAQGELRKEQDRLTGRLEDQARRQLDQLLGGKGGKPAAETDSTAADSTGAGPAAADSAAADSTQAVPSTEDKVKSLLKRLGGG